MSTKKKIFEDEKQMPIASISSAGDDMRWNKTGSWRNVRPFFDEKTATCIVACPAGNNIQGFIALANEERYEEAVRLLWETNPFPSVCGRVCNHACMDGCARCDFDEPVFIISIERFLGDYAIENNLSVDKPTKRRDEKIAVVGGGPAGLSCAYYLALKGFQVTLFEARDQLGGVLRWGIPEYRLPKAVLDAEFKKISDLGVDVRTNVAFGKDISLDDLADYSAVFIGTGLQKSRALGIDKENAKGVMPGLEFLDKVNQNEKVDVGKKAIVVGGGNTAMDVSRSALRLGADVTIVYRRTRNEMPAIADEVNEAAEEGVEMKFLATPVDVVITDNKLTEVKFQEMKLGEPDDSGRRRPVPTDSFFTLPADSLLVAIGEQSDAEEVFGSAVPLEWGLVVTDEHGKSPSPRIYAGGDIVSGASTVINAIAHGRRAADRIDAELSGAEIDKTSGQNLVDLTEINTAYFVHKKKAEMPRSGGVGGKDPFTEVNAGLTNKQIREEISRCYHCGVCNGCDNCYVFCPDAVISRKEGLYNIDYDFCKGCLICVKECPRAVFSTENEGK